MLAFNSMRFWSFRRIGRESKLYQFKWHVWDRLPPLSRLKTPALEVSEWLISRTKLLAWIVYSTDADLCSSDPFTSNNNLVQAGFSTQPVVLYYSYIQQCDWLIPHRFHWNEKASGPASHISFFPTPVSPGQIKVQCKFKECSYSTVSVFSFYDILAVLMITYSCLSKLRSEPDPIHGRDCSSRIRLILTGSSWAVRWIFNI